MTSFLVDITRLDKGTKCFNFDKWGYPKLSCKSLKDGDAKQDTCGLVPK